MNNEPELMPLSGTLRSELSKLPALDFSSNPPSLRRDSSIQTEFSYSDFAVDHETDEIGRGGNAVVYQATVSTSEFAVALKRPFPNRSIDRNAVERMLDEAKKWSRVDDHPYIASVLDWGFDGIPWVAVEYMDGGPLTTRIEEYSFLQRLWTAYAVADAVAYASGQHGITHHDLKPQNILLERTPEGTWDIPKIVDWGLSRELIQHTGTISQATPEYAAPEQFAALMPDTPVGIHTDVYQLGVVCYELLTGEHPSHLGGDVSRPSRIKPSIPDAVDSAITQALTHDRGDRIDHPILFREALKDALEELIVSQSSDGPNVTTNRAPKQGLSNENSQRDQSKREAIGELTNLDSVDKPDAYQLITTGIRSIATLTNRNERAVSMAVDRSAPTVANWINEANAHAATHQSETEDELDSITELLDQSSKSDTVSQSTGSPRDLGRAFEQDIDGTNSTVVPSISPKNHSKPSGSSTDSDGGSRGSSIQSSFEPQSTTETESTTGRYSGPFASLDRVDDEAARALESIGIDSITALSEVDTIEIGNKLDRSPNTVARWREEANGLNRPPNAVARDKEESNDYSSSPSTTETESTTGRYSGPFASLDRVDDEAARALESIGIDSIKALSEVDTIEVGNKLDRSPNTVARWREEANELNR